MPPLLLRTKLVFSQISKLGKPASSDGINEDCNEEGRGEDRGVDRADDADVAGVAGVAGGTARSRLPPVDCVATD